MWAKLLEMILGKLLKALERTPRQALARAAVTVYKRMNECHHAYVDFREEYERIFLQGNFSEHDRHGSWGRIAVQESAWAAAIEAPAEAIYRLHTVIDIFDTETLSVINRYVNEESHAYHHASRIMWSSDERRPDDMYMNVPLLAGAIGRHMPTFFDEPKTALAQQEADDTEFAAAAQRLRLFIKDTLGLAPEDVHDAVS